jgi:hypothetical protein
MNDVKIKAGKEGQEQHEGHGPDGLKPISRFSKFKGLVAGLGLATALIHGCGNNDEQPPTIPPSCDGGDAATCTDGGTTSDGGDGGTMSDGGTGGMDAGTGGKDAGMGGMDGGMGGMDAGEGGMDAGDGGGGMDGGVTFECPGLFDDSRTGLYPLNTNVNVGNYQFKYLGQSGDGVNYDIRCTSGGAAVLLNEHFTAHVATVLPRMGGVTITLQNNLSSGVSSTSAVTVSVPP